ncbi:hypothetical protein [Rhodococcus sp. A5(2022)]|uniref:hypothetical protein n=1 Tax=Rhodococcus sp. A5(2022) TaxID=3003588 RepID=UPI0022A84284|nr:hypothetical protein [Rhodococcus sp. A5(2022)]MCZ1075061.1 hypothetical protein [Rhodococcus sp. A5(2022)]
MSLPIPEFDHLALCAACGHHRTHHARGGSCCTDRDGRYEVRAQLAVCPCPAYQQPEGTP